MIICMQEQFLHFSRNGKSGLKSVLNTSSDIASLLNHFNGFFSQSKIIKKLSKWKKEKKIGWKRALIEVIIYWLILVPYVGLEALILPDLFRHETAKLIPKILQNNHPPNFFHSKLLN